MEERVCRRMKGRRLTPQRRRVLEVFSSHPQSHLSAEEVHSLLRKEKKGIGLATVYRTLELLVELDLLHRINFGDGCSRYELVPSAAGHRHHHLLCLCCRQVLEVNEDLLQHLEALIAEKHTFTIVDHQLQFFGYCARCRPAGQNSTEHPEACT